MASWEGRGCPQRGPPGPTFSPPVMTVLVIPPTHPPLGLKSREVGVAQQGSAKSSLHRPEWAVLDSSTLRRVSKTALDFCLPPPGTRLFPEFPDLPLWAIQSSPARLQHPTRTSGTEESLSPTHLCLERGPAWPGWREGRPGCWGRE